MGVSGRSRLQHFAKKVRSDSSLFCDSVEIHRLKRDIAMHCLATHLFLAILQDLSYIRLQGKYERNRNIHVIPVHQIPSKFSFVIIKMHAMGPRSCSVGKQKIYT